MAHFHSFHFFQGFGPPPPGFGGGGGGVDGGFGQFPGGQGGGGGQQTSPPQQFRQETSKVPLVSHMTQTGISFVSHHRPRPPLTSPPPGAGPFPIQSSPPSNNRPSVFEQLINQWLNNFRPGNKVLYSAKFVYFSERLNLIL